MRKILIPLLVLMLVMSGCSLVAIWRADGDVTFAVNSMSYARESLNDTSSGVVSEDEKAVKVVEKEQDHDDLSKLAPQSGPR